MPQPRSSLGDYLKEEEPTFALWKDLVHVVFRDDPNHPDIARLSPPAQVLFDVESFAGEVMSGGFGTFFGGSFGDRSHECLAALRTIGAKLGAQLLENGLSLFPGGTAPVDENERYFLLTAFEEKNPQFLEDLSREFCNRVGRTDLVPEEDLNALQLAFIRAHRFEPVEGTA